MKLPLCAFALVCALSLTVNAQTHTYNVKSHLLYIRGDLKEDGQRNLTFKIDEGQSTIETILFNGQHFVDKILARESAKGETNTVRYTASTLHPTDNTKVYVYYYIDRPNKQITLASLAGNKSAKGIKQNLRNYIVYQYY